MSIQKIIQKKLKYLSILKVLLNIRMYMKWLLNRVIDALNKAEVLKDADLSQLNLSEKLVDQNLSMFLKR